MTDDTNTEEEHEASPRPTGLAIWLIIASLIGTGAAFALTMDKIAILENPNAHLSCSFNILVSCAKNLGSWQGSVFGFPNPILGLICWPIVLAFGAALFATPGFARWWWLTFNTGVIFAMGLVVFFITASVTALHTLCPWCMVTWSITIPTFWAVTLYNLKQGNIPLPAAGRRVATTLYSWVPLITVISYAFVAIIAQLQLDWIHRAFT